ncbi:MAG: hypothetical protein J0L92_19565 [Deltaproteobacteria bacterium]|nr:hypothetical protein [Deltaproteobacteria bacterium]
MAPSTATDVEVGLDALSDAIEAGDARESLRLAGIVSIAIKNGVGGAPFVARFLDGLDRTPSEGAKLCLWQALLVHAGRQRDEGLLRELLVLPIAERGLDGFSFQKVPASFVSVVAEVAILPTASPRLRYGATVFLGHQARAHGVPLEPARDFLVSCLGDRAVAPKKSAAKRAELLLVGLGGAPAPPWSGPKKRAPTR